MTAEEFYDKHYEDSNHFYTYPGIAFIDSKKVRGIALVSPKKVQQAMEAYAEYKNKELRERIARLEKQVNWGFPTSKRNKH